MLRKYVGDEAFFEAIKLYLEKNKFNAVEADHLRLAFEEVTGEDLHWFFNQWFFGKGHPSLLIRHAYNDTTKKYYISIKQQQDINALPIFKLPIDIDFYYDGKKERKRIWVTNSSEEFVFPFDKKPDFVNVDAEKALVCSKEEKLPISERVFQYKNCPLYLDRLEALKECGSFAGVPEVSEIILLALNDKNPGIQKYAIELSEKLSSEYKTVLKENLIELAKGNAKSSLRTSAITQLANNFSDEDLTALFKQLVNDRSYSVSSAALSALAKKDSKEALSISHQFENEKNSSILFTIAQIYAEYGNDSNNPFFVKLSQQISGWKNVSFANTYTEFLKKCSDDTINAGIKILERIARFESNRLIRYFGQKGIKELAEMYAEREQRISANITKLKEKNASLTELKPLEEQLAHIQSQKNKLVSLYNSVVLPD
jgi:aminopeptidase N